VAEPADPEAPAIEELFELFNRGTIHRPELERLCDPEVRHVTRFAALEGREFDALTRETQIPIQQRLGMQVELRDGRPYRTRVHADPREALEASGLDPAA
jgi:hypothetical protein